MIHLSDLGWYDDAIRARAGVSVSRVVGLFSSSAMANFLRLRKINLLVTERFSVRVRSFESNVLGCRGWNDVIASKCLSSTRVVYNLLSYLTKQRFWESILCHYFVNFASQLKELLELLGVVVRSYSNPFLKPNAHSLAFCLLAPSRLNMRFSHRKHQEVHQRRARPLHTIWAILRGQPSGN